MKLSIRARWWTLVALSLAMVVPASGPGLLAEEGDPDDGVSRESGWGKFGLDLRYRFEFDQDDALNEDGYASTLRTVIDYTTPERYRLSAFIRFSDVSNLGAADKHNDTRNGAVGRPLVPDPEGTSVEQLFLRYDGIPDTGVTVGRQEILLGQKRFVGAVAWRQNHQTFDSLRIVQTSIPHTTWTYAYVSQANTVTLRTARMSTHLFNAAVDVRKAGTLTPYVYSIDYDSAPQTILSTLTYGARWEGTAECGARWTIPYLAELARQDDTGSNPETVDARYYRLEAGAKRDSLWLKLGLEVLGGSADDGRFTTPLATLHKWNGWADQFLLTPPDGLQDLYVGAGGQVGPVSLTGVYHHFGSDAGNLTYGQELDANVSYTAPWKQVFALDLAYYEAEDLFEDTFKLWVWSAYRF